MENIDIFSNQLPPKTRAENILKMLNWHHADLMRAQDTLRDPPVAALFSESAYNNVVSALIMADSKTSIALMYLGHPHE